MAKKSKSLCRFLLEAEAELLIRKRKGEAKEFEAEVAVGNVIFAIKKAIEKINGNGGN